MQTAEDLESFLAGAVRSPAGERADGTVEPPELEAPDIHLLAEDGAAVFNLSLPLDVWLEAVRKTQVPREFRRHIALTGFTRALLINSALAGEFAQTVADLSPADTSAMRKYLAAAPDARLNEGLFWLLHRPGIRPEVREGLLRAAGDAQIDDYRDNWWPVPRTFWSRSPPDLPFLSLQQKHQAVAEARQIADLGSARLLLATAVVAWANDQPNDPRLPEALALTVRMSRYSFPDPAADRLVQKAFEILHQRFPRSTWAKQSPYWFK